MVPRLRPSRHEKIIAVRNSIDSKHVLFSHLITRQRGISCLIVPKKNLDMTMLQAQSSHIPIE